MARETINTFADMSDRETKRRLLTAIGAMRGLYEVVIHPRRHQRSCQQNRYFHGPVCDGFIAYQREQGISVTTAEAHSHFQMTFLRKTLIHPETGEITGETLRSTRDLDIPDFSIFIDQCIAWLADLGVTVADPALYLDPVPT